MAERQKRVQRWRNGMGVCCICGQPLGAPHVVVTAEEDTDHHHYEEDLLLKEECEVRLSMMRFNMLGVHHEAHILDDYTFLEGRRNNVSFWKEFETHADSVIALNPAVFQGFKAQVENEIYNTAVANMQRTVAYRTVCACQRCNRAMTKTTEHTMAVFRCFPATRECKNAPLFETRTQTAGAARKVLQQIALYFTYKDHAWSAKEPEELLKDTSMWRCIAYLNLWGTSPLGAGTRYLLVAIFHAAHYIFLTESMFRTRFQFETWHVFVWRAFYASRYPAGTFFGMLQSQAASTFDIMHKIDGALWIRLLAGRFKGQRSALLAAEAHSDETALRSHIAALNREVQSERTLLHFLRKSQGNNRNAASIEEALKLFLAFFKFNIVVAPSGLLLQTQFNLFVSSVIRSYQKTERRPTAAATTISPYHMYSSYSVL